MLTMTTMTTMTTRPSLHIQENELAKLLETPVRAAKGRLLLKAFRDLQDAPDARAAIRACRLASFVLEELTHADAPNYSADKDDYASWFYGPRKRLVRILNEEAQRLAAAAA